MPALEPEQFIGELESRGFDFFSGVPCSIFKSVLAGFQKQDHLTYIPATKEDSALGMAAGATFAGKKSAVLMQNSGLGVSLNAILSLQRMYVIPCLLLITWRGYEGVDAPEHIEMGLKMTTLLDTIEVPHRTFEPDASAEDIRAILDWSVETMESTQKPVAILVRKGSV